MDTISEFTSNPLESDEAKAVVRWYYSLPSEFEQALCAAIRRADAVNLKRLAAGFPIEVAGYRDWVEGDLAEKLRKRGLVR